MTYFLNLFRSRTRAFALAVFVLSLGCAISALGELPSWMRNIEASSALEAALFRMMSLPGGAVLFRRPPRETRPALADLIKSQPRNADLYSLRALEDEQQLDFAAAESDWKSYVDNSSDKIGAQFALADFYHRPAARGRDQDAILNCERRAHRSRKTHTARAAALLAGV